MTDRPSRSGSPRPQPARVLIVGLGNPDMKDDGVGPALVGHLAGDRLPAGIRAITVDGDVLELGSVWRDEPEVWLVDAVSGTGQPGSVRELGHREVLGLAGGGLTTHHPSLGDCLRWLVHARSDMAAVRFRFFGVEVEALGPGEGLSDVVDAAAGRLADRLRAVADEVVKKAW